MISEKLDAFHLPELMQMNNGTPVKTPDDWRIRRRELIELLSREEYGFTPPAPEKVESTVVSENDRDTGGDFAGKALQQVIRLSFDTPGGVFSFPYVLAIPTAVKNPPVFINIGFRPDFPDRYLPVEEILDHGFAVASFCYKDVTDDSAIFDGLAQMYPRDEKTGWGKIGMRAFAASRVLDDLEKRADVDASRVCVTGHSRLGKTALWCAAQDERFTMAISNESGCSGAAIARDTQGETIRQIVDRFPFWFCGNYPAWVDREHEMPFDQHMLLALIAPRKLYVCSADGDAWAGPENEFLSCAAASEAWNLLRVPGLITPDALPAVNQPLMDGGICYHLRTGTHFHSRTDWLWHMECRKRFGV